MLAARTLVAHPELVSLWQAIYEPTAFLVGRSDDYTPLELAAAAKTVDPTWLKVRRRSRSDRRRRWSRRSSPRGR